MIANVNPHTKILRRNFPNIQTSAFITSPQTAVYNCIAYAAGDMQRWWWPDQMGFTYWPPNVTRVATLPVFQSAFGTLGFELCGDDIFEAGVEKIAIFHLNGKPTHAAKLIAQGVWSSKLGQSFDISHSRTCLDGDAPDSYGTVAFLMERQG